MSRAPHFLRVVQALALVSGLGPVAIVAAVDGCDGRTEYTGPLCTGICGPEDAGAGAYEDAGRVGSFDGGGVGFDPGIDAGPEFLDVCAGICADDGSVFADASDAETDAAVADGSTDDAGDASPDVTTDGGPLPPPDLPA